MTNEKKSAQISLNRGRKLVRTITNTKYIQLYSMCIIPLALLIMFNYVPMFGIVMAFKDFSYSEGILGSPWTGLDNFKFLFQSGDFSRIVFNTLFLNAVSSSALHPNHQ